MEWRLSEEQESLRTAIRSWLDETAPSQTLRAWLDAGDAATFEAAFIDAGWWGIGFPETIGGQDGGLIELAIVAEELARAAAPSAAWLATMIAVPALAADAEVAEAALTGDTTVLLSPAERIPDAIPLLHAHSDGTVSGEVPRVLAGDRAVRFVAAVSGDDGPHL